ncbi:hypothetical protein LQ953_05205 [Sphingomonas sp. IC-56]|uniref:hypothetical protein n=1 Tax=Sphingomonas sp. IC-56 TaxID=2898529 RepID=UPI001E5A1FC4|nr:hypothetical protein [Sphingomonas sp. IC-56]MCD2323411.1 hypothetical protein [Sphingomonas sp. IC-56]
MIERFLTGLAAKMQEPLDTRYMMIVLPEDLDPMERHLRYSVSLDAELRLAGLGCSEGGATMLSEENAHGARDVLFTVVDVDATDVDRARALLRLHLPELGCPVGTLIQYDELEDRYDGERWLLAQPLSVIEE